MFYSPLAEFIAKHTKKASVADLQKARPEIRKRFIKAKTDLDLMRDEAIERVLDNPSNYPGQLKAAVGERVEQAWKFESRAKLEAFVRSKRATLLVSGVHRISPWWKSLCDDVETRLGSGTFAVGVMTPARKPGLIIHWDEGDVTIAQLAGEKQWTIWPPVVDFAQVCNLRALTPGEKRRKPFMTVTLAPGDVLFVPRGWVHRAETKSDEPSLHVSVGIIHPDMRGRMRSDLV